MSDEIEPDREAKNEELLAELRDELAVEDEVEEEQEQHFKVKSIVPDRNSDRSTTSL